MLIVDRFEGDWAVLELDGQVFNVPRLLLPAEAREGDALRLSLEVDPSSTQDRREKIRSLEDRLFRK